MHTPNPILKKLGLSYKDRVAVIHADDIGMCQATLPAISDLFDFGLVSSAAIMAPCPWFQGAARYAREHPEADFGVHLTLTSEWDHYRWAPLSTRDPASGLLDSEGYFPRTEASVQEAAAPEVVAVELEAQIQHALKAGIVPTHADAHMGTLFHPRYLSVYFEAALKHGLPPLMTRLGEDQLRDLGLDAETAAAVMGAAGAMEARGVPLYDQITGMPLDNHENRLETAQALFDALPAGLSYFILHPSVDTPELREIAPDWRCRVADYNTFSNPQLKKHIDGQGIHIIGFRKLQQLLKS
jgi:predicted glycoside hydrolase/deacetylase ChbG (UPF0249 family)